MLRAVPHTQHISSGSLQRAAAHRGVSQQLPMGDDMSPYSEPGTELCCSPSVWPTSCRNVSMMRAWVPCGPQGEAKCKTASVDMRCKEGGAACLAAWYGFGYVVPRCSCMQCVSTVTDMAASLLLVHA